MTQVAEQHRADVIIDVLNRVGITPRVAAEVGVFIGETSARLLQAFPSLTLYLVDLWRPSPHLDRYAASQDGLAQLGEEELNAAMISAMRATDFAADRRVVLRAEQAEANLLMEGIVGPGHDLDFVFLDGDHSFDGTCEQIAMWAPSLRPGGLLMGHDYGYPNRAFGVDVAVDAFAMQNGYDRHVEAEYVWWVQVRQ